MEDAETRKELQAVDSKIRTELEKKEVTEPIEKFISAQKRRVGLDIEMFSKLAGLKQ